MTHLASLYGLSQMPSAAAGRRSGRRSSALSSPLAASADVANHLGVEAETRAAREQPVVRIPLDQRGRAADACRYVAEVTISRCSAFCAPLAAIELRRQPVEQLGMGRRRALRAEVLAGLDEAAAEELLPGAVDRRRAR